jgi:lambda family phage portal protein
MSRRELQALIKKASKPTLWDRFIKPFSPGRALNNQRNRVKMAVANAYVGASKSRRSLSQWMTSDGDADYDLLPDLAALRERSRDLYRNTPLATGAINTKVTNIVGTGLRLVPTIDREALNLSEDQANEWEAAAAREWKIWSESQECDAERTLTFTEIQELTLRSVLLSGDLFIMLPYIRRAGSPYDLKLQLIEADRISNPDFQIDNDKLAGGVEKDDAGAPLYYYILNQHPGNYRITKAMEWSRVRAFGERTGRRNVLHLYHKLRIGQTRGVPDLAPVIEPLKQLDRYTEAEIMAAVISGMFTAFVESEGGDNSFAPMEPTSETGAKSSDDDIKLGYGAVVDLAPGEKITTANPNRPNDAFDPFVQSVLRQIGVALELPFEILIKHFTASYSAARASMLEAWKFFMMRRQWLARSLCQPVYEAVITEAIVKGRLSAPGFLREHRIRKAYLSARWIGPGRGLIDPLKENKADEIAEDRGWKTASDNTAERGGDWERNHKQRVKETMMRRNDQLDVAQSAEDISEQQEE